MRGRTEKEQGPASAAPESTALDAATSDFFVSRESVVHTKPSPIVRIQGAHPLRLAILESLLVEGGIVPAVMWAARPTFDGGPRGPWVTPLSDQLTRAVVNLGGLDELHDLADRWLEADPHGEIRPDRRDELTVGLLLLAHLSRAALEVEGRVWCWTELPQRDPLRRSRWWSRRQSNLRFRSLGSDRAS